MRWVELSGLVVCEWNGRSGLWEVEMVMSGLVSGPVGPVGLSAREVAKISSFVMVFFPQVLNI